MTRASSDATFIHVKATQVPYCTKHLTTVLNEWTYIDCDEFRGSDVCKTVVGEMNVVQMTNG